MIELTIATQKNYSSWSLRGWLVMRWAGIAFSEREIDLAQPGYGEQRIEAVRAVSPGGLVPAMHIDGTTIWDSLAIAEWAAEQNPELWPADPMKRAWARSVCAEMHSGFAGVRRDLSMNILRRCTARDLPADTLRNIERIDAIWSDCRKAHASKGPWLFGKRSIADAFYAPVATRFRTYGVEVSAHGSGWMETVLADPDFREWEAACIPDSWDVRGFSVIDGLYR